MNLEIIRQEIKSNLNKSINVKVFGMRNKTNEYNGYITAVYPNIFTILTVDGEKSFAYRDIITGDIKINYN